MIACVYILKESISTKETKIYNRILILSMICIILELNLCYNIYIKVPVYSFYNLFINRSFLICLYSWFTLFTMYLLYISLNKNSYKKIKEYIVIISILIVLSLIGLPIELINEGDVAYSTGWATYLLYFICVIYSISWIIIIFKYKNQIGYKKCYPFIAFIICFIILLAIRVINPAILLNSFSVAFPTVLMFFTIENPDAKMVSLLNENRVLIEKSNEEKTNLLFKISQEVKKPILDIISYNDINLKSGDNSIKENCKYIDLNARELMMLADGLLDISKMDYKNIKIDSSKYNVHNLFKEIKHRTNNYIENNIDFRFNISNIVPMYLYGDSIKLKQVISSIIFNCLKYTKTGFIELDVNSIVKYDVCRLLITISDSGKGIELEKINKILSADGNLTDEELLRLDSLDVDLIVTNKLIKMLNGTLIIKSDVGVGSQFLIIIDQKIVSNDKKENTKYYENVISKKKILVVDDDIKMLNKISKILEEKNYEVICSSYGKDLLDRINNKEKIDFIIIDDENKDNSALEILKKFKSVYNTSIPVFVMLENSKLFMSKHYVDDGFTNYIEKNNLEKELDKLDKYV